MTRPGKKTIGQPLFEDLATVHEDYAVRYLSGKTHLVSDDQHNYALTREVADDLEYLAYEFRIEGRRNLIKE